MNNIYPGLTGEIEFVDKPNIFDSNNILIGYYYYRYFGKRDLFSLESQHFEFTKFMLDEHEQIMVNNVMHILRNRIHHRFDIDFYEIFGEIDRKTKFVTQLFFRDMFTGLGFIIYNINNKIHVSGVSRAESLSVIGRFLNGNINEITFDSTLLNHSQGIIFFLRNNPGLNGTFKYVDIIPNVVLYELKQFVNMYDKNNKCNDIRYQRYLCDLVSECKTLEFTKPSKTPTITDKKTNDLDEDHWDIDKPVEYIKSLKQKILPFRTSNIHITEVEIDIETGHYDLFVCPVIDSEQQDFLNQFHRKSLTYKKILNDNHPTYKAYAYPMGDYTRLLLDFGSNNKFILHVYDSNVLLSLTHIISYQVIHLLENIKVDNTLEW